MEEDPDFYRAHDCLFMAYSGKKMYPEAIVEMKKMAELSADPFEVEKARAVEEGFKEGGWKGSAAKVLPLLLARRTTGFCLPLHDCREVCGYGECR